MFPSTTTALLRRMAREFDDLLAEREFPFRRLGTFEPAVWTPELDVIDRDGKLLFLLDLPGLTKDDVKVDVTDSTLTVTGERKREVEETDEGFVRSERAYGVFSRSVMLPEGARIADVKATFRNGVLEIEVPIAAAVEPPTRTVPILEAPEAKAKTAA
jgi:HSP20 family protein